MIETGPKLELEMDRDLTEGIAYALDESRQMICELRVPQEKPPVGTRILVMSLEDWVRVQKAFGQVRVVHG